MKIEEFKAWFEGFSENIEGEPNDAQWRKVKEKVSEIDGMPIAPTIIERHYQDYSQYWPHPYRVWLSDTPTTNLSAMGASDAELLSSE